MNQISINPWMTMEIQRRHTELIKEADKYRLISQFIKDEEQKMPSKSRFLARIGKGLITLGSNLEARFGIEPDDSLRFEGQSDPSGCD